MKQDMSDGYAALVFDLTLPSSAYDLIKTDAASQLHLDSVSMTTTCLGEAPYVASGWEGVPLDGYPPAREITNTIYRNRTALSDEDEK
jgi:hypothetical protein